MIDFDFAQKNPDIVEPLESVAEAALELCCGTHVGQITYSRSLLHSIARNVKDLKGENVIGCTFLSANIG